MSEVTLGDLHNKLDKIQEGVYSKIDTVQTGINLKIDGIQTTITAIKVNAASQPCEVHQAKIKELEKTINRLWALTGGLFLATLGLGIRAILI